MDGAGDLANAGELQGDGMVGFTGVLLSLLIENYSVYLIDEPESFLHPPQARILGTEIPELLDNRQAFISTHSEHLLKGLLEAAPERIKVVRISREGNKNSFSIINTDDISKIWKDTLLRQSNVLQGLFYDAVVICESDSDCQFYSAILTYNKEQMSKRDNTFFVYGSTKSRYWRWDVSRYSTSCRTGRSISFRRQTARSLRLIRISTTCPARCSRRSTGSQAAFSGDGP